MKEKNLYECHVFVCTNKKENGKPNCADKGGVELRMELKVWAQQKYGKKVRINASGCLDFCSKGIVAVIYPQSEWRMELKNTDAEILKLEIDRIMGSQNENS